MAIGSGGGDHGEASPRGSTVAGPRRRHPRNWGRDVRDAEDEAGRARRRVARVRARSSLSESPHPPWSRAKKKTLSSADARGKRAVGSVRRSNQARARRETTVVGCRSMFPRRARVPSSAPRATARFPATAPRDVGSLRRSRTTIGSARVRFANRCAPWRRWCGARRARGRGGRGDRRRRWQTS